VVSEVGRRIAFHRLLVRHFMHSPAFDPGSFVVQNHPEKGNISYQHRTGCKVVSSGFLNFSKIIRGSVIFKVLKRKAYG
jgi:hypothetical protein